MKQTSMQLALSWWQHARHKWQQFHQFDLMSDGDVDRMAQDLGLSSDELRRVSREPDGIPVLLGRRLTALQLAPSDIVAIAPLLLRDLERTCAVCSEKKRCKDDLDATVDPVGWESYCPNSGTLRTLI